MRYIVLLLFAFIASACQTEPDEVDTQALSEFRTVAQLWSSNGISMAFERLGSWQQARLAGEEVALSLEVDCRWRKMNAVTQDSFYVEKGWRPSEDLARFHLADTAKLEFKKGFQSAQKRLWSQYGLKPCSSLP